MSAADGSSTATLGAAGGAAVPVAVKPGRHREASLYHALAGAGAGDGRTLAELRSAALAAYDDSELPVWRRSGFWTTSFAELDEGLLDGDGATVADKTPMRAQGIPDFVANAIPDRPKAGRIVQVDESVVHVELDPALAERGVILCSLEEAAVEHTDLFEAWYSKRLTIDRHKLEAANAAFWSGGAFLYVPDGLRVEDPFEVVYAISGPGVAQYGRTLAIGGKGSDFKLHEHDLAADFEGSDSSPCMRALLSCTCKTTRAAASPKSRTGAQATYSTQARASWASAGMPTATGCRPCWADTWCATIWSWR